MQGLELATCDRALAPAGGAPEWVHLLPDGHMKGRDGREFELVDPGALVLAFQSGGVNLPIDYEHQNDKPEARLSGPVPAAGWIKELKAAEGGLWGRVEWTATASEMIGRKEYRYLSPSILFHPKTRQIVKLKGAGLVHNPNLFLTALASQENTMLAAKTPQHSEGVDLAAELAKIFNLPTDTPVADLLAKLADIMKVTPDPAKFIPVAAVQEMLSDRQFERASVRKDRVQDKVNAAVKQGYVTRGMRDWALALCSSDETAFDDFCTKAGPSFAHLSQPIFRSGQPPTAAQTHEDSELATAICEQLGLKPGSLSN